MKTASYAGDPARTQKALKIAAIYAVLGMAWIALSDRLVALPSPSGLITETALQTIKGSLFVLATAAAFFLLLRREPQQSLRQHHAALFSFMVEAACDITWKSSADGSQLALIYDRHNRLDRPNDSLQTLLNVHPNDRDKLRKAWQRALASGQELSEELRIDDGAGNYRYFGCRAVPVRRPSGEISEWVGGCIDIQLRMSQMRELRGSREALRIAVEEANIGASIWDIASDTMNICPQFKVQMGLPADQRPLSEFNELRDWIHPDDCATAEKLLKHCKATGEGFSTDFRLRHTDGSYRWIHSRGTCIKDEDGTPIQVLSMNLDITERKNVEIQLRDMAFHDALTGVPNRRAANDLLERAITAADQSGHKVGVLCIDLDHFKTINDSHGHVVGDEVLIEFAQRVQSVLGEDDHVCRLGGDEFAVFTSAREDKSAITDVAKSIVYALQKPFTVSNLDIYSGATIGISVYPDDSSNTATLIEYADAALNKGKKNNRSTINIFEPKIVLEPARWLERKTALQKAVQRGEISVEYQPQLHLRTQQVVGFEALARWHSTELGPVSAADFIPLAEEIGLIADIDRHVLSLVAQQVAQWQRSGLTAVPVAVNISPQHLEQAGSVETIAQVAGVDAIDSSALEFELTETAIMQNVHQVRDHLLELRARGFRIAIDDFGTGYSSLQNLQQFKVHRVKIDRTFIGGLLTNSDDAAIVRSVIQLAHDLGLEVVAEGVELREQAYALAQLGCDIIQGYYYSRPISADLAADFLDTASALAQA